MSPTYLTREGLAKLQAEHKALMKQKRELTEEVSRAAALGDLRENAEYHAARERLQHVSERLAEVDGRLSSVILIDDLQIADGEVRVGATVTLEDQQTKERFDYHIVGPTEADPLRGKLSIEAPLAKQMLGKKEGDSFTLKLPNALVPYKILGVRRE
jgi:transcription elongation factor GreA